MLDLALVAIVVVNAAWGILSGFVAGALRLVATVLAMAAWFVVGGWLAARFAPEGPWSVLGALILAGLVLTTLASLLVGLVAAAIEPPLRARPGLDRLNRLFGMLPGAAWGVVVAYVVAWIAVAAVPVGSSPLARQLLNAGRGPVDALLAKVPAGWPGLAVSPEGIMFIPTSGDASREKAPPDQLEKKMLDLVNAERRKAGLHALVWDDALAKIARAHSRDMLAHNYFSHPDLQGHKADYRAAKAGIRYRILGENLAFAPDLAMAHRGLMLSPEHRENILHPDYSRIGIGIVRLPPDAHFLPRMPGQTGPLPGRVAPGSLIVTQVFRD